MRRWKGRRNKLFNFHFAVEASKKYMDYYGRMVYAVYISDLITIERAC